MWGVGARDLHGIGQENDEDKADEEVPEQGGEKIVIELMTSDRTLNRQQPEVNYSPRPSPQLVSLE